jgi:hypothetical protein
MIITLSFTKVGQDRVSDLLGSSSMAQDSSGNYGGGGGPWVMDCPSQAEERNLVQRLRHYRQYLGGGGLASRQTLLTNPGSGGP